jgi:iron complex outermembrane receptor protein
LKGINVIKTSKAQLLLTTLLSGAIVGFAGAPAFAQSDDEVVQVPQSAAQIAEQEDRDEVVVTGSRLRKSAYTSPSPLTSLSVDDGRKLGVTSIADLVGRSPVVNGARIDATLNTNAGNSNATEAPPTGGTGSTNINLRGLSPERTLILLNGRRLASTGVRGAPAQPDIGLIPFSLIKGVDILTEAGSAIYGADAVAGVVNVTLRTDFEGLEISGSVTAPDHPGGDEIQLGMIAGVSNDRGHIVFGAEYTDRSRVLAGTRDYASTLGIREIGPNGEILTADVNGFFDNNLFTGDTFDIICYTPGQTGPRGVADFSNCASQSVPTGLRDRGDGNFVYHSEFNDDDERGRSDLVGESERISILTSGEYDLDLWANEQAYFEAFYFNRQNFSRGTNEQIFPTVTGLINEVDANGNVIGQVDNPFNPFAVDVIPILTIDDIPQNRDVELQQIRLVGGLRGDINVGWFGENEWRWDAYASYDRGTGFQSQPVLNENNFTAALNPVQNPDGSITCSLQTAADIFGILSPETCVPVNLFAPSIFSGGEFGDGGFSSQAERDFLINTRTNRTAIDQYVFSAFVDGKVTESPWGGDVTIGFGYEYRKDSIESRNSADGVRGNILAENPLQEGQTDGSRSFNEYFGEINIPLVVDKPGIALLNIDGALRQTEESSYSGTTYRVRAQYKPVDWFSISGGYGTSFRAPNLREQFLASQGGGVGGTNDPCININIQQSLSGFGGDDTQRGQLLVNNCVASGVVFTDSDGNGFLDTTVLGTTGVTTIPTFTGGNSTLNPERSRTYTLTASFDQPWFDGFDFKVAASYYDIKIKDSIEEPGIGQIVGGCFNDTDFPNQTSPFCNLIGRNTAGNAASNLLNSIDITFFNIGEITAKGIDVNTQLSYTPFSYAGAPVEWVFSTAIARQIEQERQIFDPSDRDDDVGEIGTPKWRINLNSATSWKDFTFTTESRFIGAQRNDFVAPSASGFFLDSAGNRLQTTPVNFVESVWYHDAAITYAQDAWDITFGIRNVFDKEPPLINSSLGGQRNNAVSSAGYDFFGRTFFANARKSF